MSQSNVARRKKILSLKGENEVLLVSQSQDSALNWLKEIDELNWLESRESSGDSFMAFEEEIEDTPYGQTDVGLWAP